MTGDQSHNARFRVIQQQLIDARDRLDFQATRLIRMQAFNATALRLHSDEDFAAAVTDAIIDIFELQFAFCWLLRSHTIADAHAAVLGQQLPAENYNEIGELLLRHCETNGYTCELDATALSQLGTLMPIEQGITALCRDTDNQPLALILGGNTHAGAGYFGLLSDELEDAFTLFSDQVAALLDNHRSREKIQQLHEQSEAVFRAIPDLMFELDELGNYIHVWARDESLLYAQEEAVLGRSVADVLPPVAARTVMAAISEASIQGACHGRHIALPLDTGLYWFELSVAKKPGCSQPSRYILLSRDITERKQSEERISLLFQAIEQSPVSVVITDKNGIIEYVNGACERVTGYLAPELLGASWDVFQSGFVSRGKYDQIMKTVMAGKPWKGELLNQKKNGELYWEQAHIAPVFDNSGQPMRILAVFEDISLRKEQEDKILHQAYYDTLTRLPNRMLVLDRLEQLVSKSHRQRKLAAVIFLDLDDFKKINDALGHDIGDQVLVEAGMRISSAARADDTVGRLGGDEFIILLDGLEKAEDASRVAQSAIENLRTPFNLEKRELLLTVSAGIALYPDDGHTCRDLLSKADSAMYHAKSMGRNTFAFYTDTLNRGMHRRLEIEERLQGALERDELYLVYQSKIDLRDDSIRGFEVLIRWRNPVLGDVSPGEFVSIAEHSGQIVALGNFVIRQGLRQLSEWQKASGQPLSLSINLSPRQFRDPQLISIIERALLDSEVPPGTVEFEITEGILMEGFEEVSDKLQQIKLLGLHLSMDDFGTGYSSLSYLRNYPFDHLKIDRSFIHDMTEDNADYQLVNAAIAMGHGLGLEVVAEGVETPEQKELLKKLGCDTAQGFLFSKPIEADKIPELLLADPACRH